MKTSNLNPQELNEYYSHKEVISNRMQWLAVITILSAVITFALILSNTQISMF